MTVPAALQCQRLDQPIKFQDWRDQGIAPTYTARHRVLFAFKKPNLPPWMPEERRLHWDWHTPIREWLDRNIEGKYSMEEDHVLFSRAEDALLCYVRFVGPRKSN